MGDNQAPNEQQKKKPLVPILVAVAAVIIAVVAFVALNKKPQVEVPDMVGLRSSEATEMLTKANLKAGNITTKKDDAILFADFVLEQSVASGTKVDEGTAINLVISEGTSLDEPTKAPDVVGLDPEEAEQKLYDAYFIPQQGDHVYSDTVEPGKVCAQSVAPGTEATPLTVTVTYNVSLGQEKVKVPDVVGMTAKKAYETLQNAGLSYNETASYSDNVEKDKIISQSHAKDTEVVKGTIITIEKSLGAKPKTQVLVPNVYNYSYADAKRTLESAGLTLVCEGDTNGTVVSVTPAPNTKVDEGSKVKLKFAVPTPPTPPTPPEPEPEPVVPGTKLTAEQCRDIAFEVFNKDGKATNTKITGPYEEGGATCFTIEFDKGDNHFKVVVNADTGLIVSASSDDGVTETIYNSDGTVLSTRNLPVGPIDQA
ncbi:MAG: PASTA domain-containing protein [Coriobacteriales bacterium]|nr:PASTA domain-containing protein [Coriobacteriales bacterium]